MTRRYFKTPKLPLKAFIAGDTVEVQDARGDTVVKWTGFEASDFPLKAQKRMARLLVAAANAKA